jgi:hypothetical protein
MAVIRIQGRRKPTSVSIGGRALAPADYVVGDGSILIRFANSVDPIPIEIKY